MASEKKDDCCAVKNPQFGKLEKGIFARDKNREIALIGDNDEKVQSYAREIARRLTPQYRVAFAHKIEAEKSVNPSFSIEYIEKQGLNSLNFEGTMGEWQFRKIFADADLVLTNANHFPEVEKKIDLAEGLMLIMPEIYAWLIPPSVKGLILAGGRSSRMGKDKGSLDYHGKPQREYAADLLQNMGIETFISCRPDQLNTLNGYKGITDAFVDMGPVGGILSAFLFDPNAAWLVVACDLPLITTDFLKILLENRRPSALATAFKSPDNDFPEPLITLWEPKAYPEILQFLSQGVMCPRKVLINSDTHLLTPSVSAALLNANTPDDAASASELLQKAHLG